MNENAGSGKVDLAYDAPSFLTIHNIKTSEVVVRIHPNGQVEFGPGYTADDASKKFWEDASELPAKLAQVEKERDELKAELERWKEVTREREEFAAAETNHANRWAERAHAAEKRCEQIGDEASLAQAERDSAKAELEELRELMRAFGSEEAIAAFCRDVAKRQREACAEAALQWSKSQAEIASDKERDSIMASAEMHREESIMASRISSAIRATPLVTNKEDT